MAVALPLSLGWIGSIGWSSDSLMGGLMGGTPKLGLGEGAPPNLELVSAGEADAELVTGGVKDRRFGALALASIGRRSKMRSPNALTIGEAASGVADPKDRPLDRLSILDMADDCCS
jgi:hypothetical protein